MKRPFFLKGKVIAKATEGRDWVIILFSLRLAFFIWIVHYLSLDYTVHFDYRLRVETEMSGHASRSETQQPLIIRGRAKGFYIIKQRLGIGSWLTLEVPERLLHPNTSAGNEDSFQLLGSELRNLLSEALTPDVEVEYVVTEEMDFIIPRVRHKKVPVIPRTDITFKEQYAAISPIRLQPDSVVLYGKERYLNRVDSVFTKPITARQLSGNLRRMVDLMDIWGITYAEDKVYATLEVDRYVEHTLEFPVDLLNVPADRRMICIPNQVRLKVRQFYPITEVDLASHFQVVVDYNEVMKTLEMQVVPTVYNELSNISAQYELDPPYVEVMQVR